MELKIKISATASNERNFAGHIWGIPGSNGHMGATACIVVTGFLLYYERTNHWQALA